MEWEVQMHEMAREMTGQLTSKMAALEHLIREADRAAARLEAALGAASRRHEGESVHEARQEPRAPGPQEPLPAPASQADALKPGAAGVARVQEDRLAERPSRERRHEEVYTLADYGYDAPEIARRLATPVGEIELILGLRQKR
jgi:hypothetical protein